jgi:glutamate/aspartate transport system substrate-binding protein
MHLGVLLVTLAAALTPCRAAEPDSPTLRKIRATGVITLGHRLGSVPFSYLDSRLQPVGYSMDLCHRVVTDMKARLGLPDLEVKLIAVTSATRLPLVANGTVDLECGVTTNTAERQKTQSFSVTTFVAASRLLSKKASGIRSLDDLRGKPVASTIGTTSIQMLHAMNDTRGYDMKILADLDDADGFRMVATDRAVAFAMDDVLLRGLLTTVRNSSEYEISDEALSIEPYGIGMRRDDPAFKQLVDGVLISLFRNGEIHTIYRRWFMSPIPSKGVNLQMPMSRALERVIQAPTDSPDPAHYR